MRVSLEYRLGRVIPRLHLTPEERVFFERHQIPTYITHRQVMIGLHEENNPRYLLLDSPCEEYYPQRTLTREDLEACASFILEDFRHRLLRLDQPRLRVDLYLDLTEENLRALSSYEFIEPSRQVSPPIVVVGNRVYRMILEDQGTSDVSEELEREMNNWRERIRASYEAQLNSVRNEYERILMRMRERLSTTFTLPEIKISEVFDQNIVFFSKVGDFPCYGFILPFHLRQTKIKISGRIYRLKEEFQVIEDCYLTLAFNERGQCFLHFLSYDGIGEELVDFAHKMPGRDFCAGTYEIPILDLTRDVIPQVVEIRNQLERVFETVIAGSLGTGLLERMSRLADLLSSDRWQEVVEEEIESTVWEAS